MCFIDVYMFSVTSDTQWMSHVDIGLWFNFFMGRLTDNVDYIYVLTLFMFV